MSFEAISKLSINPFLGSKIIQSFLNGCNNNEIFYPIVFIVLPFVFHPETRKQLYNSKKSSNLHTRFFNKNANRSLLSDIENRLMNTSNLTKKSLIIGVNEGTITIGYTIRLCNDTQLNIADNDVLKEYIKAAYNLGRMCSKINHLELVRNIGGIAI